MEQITTNVTEQQDGEKLADATMKFPYAGVENFRKGPEAAQKVLDTFYPGYKIDKELSEKRQQVFVNPTLKNSVINFNGTQNPLDAFKTWGDVMSEEQKKIIQAGTVISSKVLPETVAAGASAGEFLGTLSDLYNVPDFSQRVDSGGKLIDAAVKKYPGFNTLLTGYSLGGAVAKELANKKKMNALLFNSAIGKTKVTDDQKNRIIEFRINNDVVSKRFAEPVSNKIFTIEKSRDEPRGILKSLERLVIDTDRAKEPVDPMQAHWLQNFAINREEFYQQLERGPVGKPMTKQLKMSGKDTFQKMVKDKSKTVKTRLTDTELNNIIRCKPCPKGKLICKCSSSPSP